MHPIAAADEIAEIRVEIARLQAREAALRALLLTAPPELLTGRWYRAEVLEQRVRKFDPALLPREIQENPSFWRESMRSVVRTLPVQARPSRPGWPIRRSAEGTAQNGPLH